MRVLIALVCFTATCGFVYLAYSTRTTASYVAVVASIAAFLTALANIKKQSTSKNQLSQKVGNNSFGIQAGNDVNINKNKE